MPKLVAPHGSENLRPLLLKDEKKAELMQRAENLLTVPMQSREVCDLLLLSMGAYTPLYGFMTEEDWYSVCNDMRLSTGLFWPIPITLSVNKDLSDQIQEGQEVALADGDTEQIMAVLRVENKYTPNHELECKKVFGTTDLKHPGVSKVMAQPEVNLGGSVKVIDEGSFPREFKDLYVRPEESRAIFKRRGWSKITAFQTRNPMHRSHEHLVKIAIDVTDGVLIHQVLGKLK
ncbi:MAG: sulfate adenylyltransferase, partial [Pseudomonadota bacterium]|nr:sulfate adenylyltransferase [Pseudomonadota bacterium]